MLNSSRKDTTDWRVEKAVKILNECVDNYMIFIDTCSFMHPASDEFWKHMIPILTERNKPVIVAFEVLKELKKHSFDLKDIEKANSARSALKMLDKLMKSNIAEIRGEPYDDDLADSLYQVIFTKFRTQYNLLLITQDRGLARDILKLNNTGSVESKEISVKRINNYGYLSNIEKEALV